MRTHYRNGDEITLVHNGCDGCDILSINNRLSHENGCQFSWKDYKISCRLCGYSFLRSERDQVMCDDCIADSETITIEAEKYDSVESIERTHAAYKKYWRENK